MTAPPVKGAVETPTARTPWQTLLGISLFLVLSVGLVYWPVTHHDFVSYDDTDYVTANPMVKAGFTREGFTWVWQSEVARNWHPVTMLSHMLDCQLYGLRPGWHHLTSVLLHAANSVLLFFFLRRLTRATWRSAFVAVLFALHPLHVESVAWVAERKDVLSTVFLMLTLSCYARYTERREPLSYLLALFWFALGLMSKPMLVTVPFVLLLLDYWPLRRNEAGETRGAQEVSRKAAGGGRSRRRWPEWPLLWEKVPFLLLSLASCVVTFRVQQSGGAVLDTVNSPITGRIANALMSYVRYLGKMVWPEGLAALYVRKAPWPLWEVLLAAGLLLCILFAVLRLGRRSPYLVVGWFWYVGTLVPVIGLVQVGMQTMADRYTYIPLIGIFILIAWGGSEIVTRLRVPRPALTLGITAIILCYLGMTRQQIAFWKNSQTLFTRMITVVEGNYMAHYNLGNHYSREGNFAEAARHYEAALQTEPNYAEAHNNLGTVLLRLGRKDEAIAHHAAAARLRPEYLYYFNLGNALIDAGKPAEAIPAYREALRRKADSAAAHYHLGLACQAHGQPQEAMAEFRAALRLQPGLEGAEHQLANRLADAGKLEEAMAHYHAALRLDPDHAESYNGLGICYAMQGKLPEAEQQFRQAVRLKPVLAGAQSNLGNALGAQNRIGEAIPHYLKSLEIEPNDSQTHFNLGVSLLRQGRPSEAKAHLEEALRLRPDYPEARQALSALPPAAAPSP